MDGVKEMTMEDLILMMNVTEEEAFVINVFLKREDEGDEK